MKPFIKIMAICLILNLLIISSNAYDLSVIIDNDTSNTSIFNNHREGFEIYVTGSSHYNSDCRRDYNTEKYNRYYWNLNSSYGNITKYTPINLMVGIYLNNPLFQDTQAGYWLQQKDGGYMMATVNQNTAPVGWSYIYYTVNLNYATPGLYSVTGISVRASGNGSGYTGADAISLYGTTG